MSWSYAHDDIGIRLFDACLRAGAPLPVTPGMRVLDLGCSESNWLELARKAWPDVTFVGVDQRKQDRKRGVTVQGDVMQPDLFRAGEFDAIVAISSIEHIGLGHYQDPVNSDGDSIAMRNCWHWLKPGGWMYLDVPYDPSGYRVRGTKCRIYDDEALYWRLRRLTRRTEEPGIAIPCAWAGYATGLESGVLISKPTQPVEPFHYCAMVLQKPLTERTPHNAVV